MLCVLSRNDVLFYFELTVFIIGDSNGYLKDSIIIGDALFLSRGVLSYHKVSLALSYLGDINRSERKLAVARVCGGVDCGFTINAEGSIGFIEVKGKFIIDKVAVCNSLYAL